MLSASGDADGKRLEEGVNVREFLIRDFGLLIGRHLRGVGRVSKVRDEPRLAHPRRVQSSGEASFTRVAVAGVARVLLVEDFSVLGVALEISGILRRLGLDRPLSESARGPSGARGRRFESHRPTYPRGCVRTSIIAGSPALTRSSPRRSAGPSALGSSIGPSPYIP